MENTVVLPCGAHLAGFVDRTTGILLGERTETTTLQNDVAESDAKITDGNIETDEDK